MKTLGTIFIIVSIILAIGAIMKTKPGYNERAFLADVQDTKDKYGTDPGEQEKWDRQLEKFRSERKEYILWFSIPAGVLLITGLILVVVPTQNLSR